MFLSILELTTKLERNQSARCSLGSSVGDHLILGTGGNLLTGLTSPLLHKLALYIQYTYSLIPVLEFSRYAPIMNLTWSLALDDFYTGICTGFYDGQ